MFSMVSVKNEQKCNIAMKLCENLRIIQGHGFVENVPLVVNGVEA